MEGIFCGVLALSLILICFGELSSAEAKTNYPIPENPLKGSRIFFKKGCIGCHKVWDLGATFGPDLTRIGRQMGFFGLAGALWSHSPKMIEVMKEKGIERPVLTPEEIEELIAFLYYVGFFDAPGDYRKGEDTFARKGCIQCHSLGIGDKKKGLALDQYGRYFSPVFIAVALWNHGGLIKESMSRQSFGPGEMEDILAFIREDALNESGDVNYIQPGNPREGKVVFAEKRCTACHGNDGEYLKTDSLRKSLTEIVASMWSHSFQMWGEMEKRKIKVPRFNIQEMADLTAFLYFVPYYRGQGLAARGQQIFVEKGCAQCHTQGGTLEKNRRSLGGVSRLTIFNLLSEMWNHIPQMEKMVTEFNLVWPRFEKDEMHDLLLYIQTLK